MAGKLERGKSCRQDLFHHRGGDLTLTSIFNIDMLHLGKINYQLSIIILSYRWCPGELVPRDGDLPDGADEAQQHLGLHRRRHQGQRRMDSGCIRVSLLMGVVNFISSDYHDSLSIFKISHFGNPFYVCRSDL